MTMDEMSEAIVRIDERQKAATIQLARLSESIDDLCARVMELEQMRWKAIGALSVVIIVVELLSKVILKFI